MVLVLPVVECTVPFEENDLQLREKRHLFYYKMDFISGSIGGMAGTLVGHPLDTAKVRLQTQYDHRYRGSFHCLYSIVKREGPLGLWKGVSSPLAGVAFVNAIVFGVYGTTLKLFDDKRALSTHFIAGASAGFAQSFVTAPIELFKLRVQVQRADGVFGHLYRSPYDCAVQVFRQQGVRGMCRGMLFTHLRDCPAYGCYFASYEFMARRFSKDGSMEGLTTLSLLLAGGLAGQFSWLFNYPTDMVKTRFQADGTDAAHTRYRSYRDCIRRTFAEDGFRTFFHGFGPTILRAFPTNAATFFTVEWILRINETYLRAYFAEEKMAPSHYEIKDRLHNHPGHDHMWHLFHVGEAGSTFIDPMVHGSRLL